MFHDGQKVFDMLEGISGGDQVPSPKELDPSADELAMWISANRSRAEVVFRRLLDYARDEFSAQAETIGRFLPLLIYRLDPEQQKALFEECIRRVQLDLSSGSATWIVLALFLAANYAAMRESGQRVKLIAALRVLQRVPRYKKDVFIRDLLFIHERMGLSDLETALQAR